MSSLPPLPSPVDDYDPPPGTRWSPAVWRHVIGGIGARLRGLEAQRVELEDVLNELKTFGIQRLDEAIAPLITEQEQALADLQQQTETVIAQLDVAIAALQEQVDEILAGGISATNVNETATRVFLTPEQKAKIAQIESDLDLLVDTIPGLLAAKADITSVYTKTETDALVATAPTTVATPSGTSLTLTSASARFVAFSATLKGAPVNLPSGLTIPVGTSFRIHNRGSYAFYVVDGAGRKIATVTPDDTVVAVLGAAGSAGGSWYLASRGSQSRVYSDLESTFSIGTVGGGSAIDVISETALLLVYKESQYVRKAVVLTVTGNVVTAVGTPVVFTTFNGLSYGGALGVVVLSPTRAIVAYHYDDVGMYYRAITISGTTLTVRNERSTSDNGTSFTGYTASNNFFRISATQFLQYSSQNNMSLLTYNEGPDSYTIHQSTAPPNTNQIITAFKVNATDFVIGGPGGGTYYMYVVKVAATSYTFGTPYNLGTSGSAWGAAMTSSTFLVNWMPGAGQTDRVELATYSISGTTISKIESLFLVGTPRPGGQMFPLATNVALMLDFNGPRLVYANPPRFGSAGEVITFNAGAKSILLTPSKVFSYLEGSPFKSLVVEALP